MRVLYSFPQRLGAGRICIIPWHQMVGLAAAGAEVTALVGSIERDPGANVSCRATLCPGGVKIPFRLLGMNLVNAIHDYRTASWLSINYGKIDIVHGWPSASLRTIKIARQHGIPFVLERPNAHTAFAYEEVAAECKRLDFSLPRDHDHSWNAALLRHEEREYASTDYLICPSEFVAQTFRERNFNESKLLRHRYGYDPTRFSPATERIQSPGINMVYAGVCYPRKGLHYALEAWINSTASKTGQFKICGEFVEGYEEKLGSMLAHPSVKVMGHRNDLPELFRSADLFVLPSVEEGSALVTYEARASGCVLLVSDRAGAVCEHQVDSLIHDARDVDALTSHISLLADNPGILARLRENSMATILELTWSRAGRILLDCYQMALERRGISTSRY